MLFQCLCGLEPVCHFTQADDEPIKFWNYYFHRRNGINNVTIGNADDLKGTAFKNVKKIEVISSHVSVNTETTFVVDSTPAFKTDVTVFQEGDLDIKYTSGLGACEIKNKYYYKYPGGDEPATDDDFVQGNPAGGLKETYVKVTADLSGSGENADKSDINVEGYEGYKLTVGETDGTKGFHLMNVDPLLYAVAYQFDNNSVDLIYDHMGNNSVKKEDIDVSAGTVTMEGFKRGYYVTNNGRLEAWIAAGEEVSVKILPKPGYQYIKGSLNVNGNFFDTTASESNEADAIGLYTYTMGAHAGHMNAGFIKTENLVVVKDEGEDKCDTVIADGSTIASADINAQMTIAGAKVDDAGKAKFGEKAPGMHFESYIDIAVAERTVKNYDVSKSNAEQEAWTKPAEELAGEAEVSIKLDPAKFDGTDFTVVREHKGAYETIPAKYDAATHKLTFKSNRFSTYAIGTDGYKEAPDESELGTEDDYTMPGMRPADADPAKDKRTSIKDAVVTLSKSGKYTYAGKLIEPTVTVKLGGKKLVNGTDYRVMYANAIKAGTYKVVVNGINDYKDSASADLVIAGKKVTALKFYPGSVMVDENGKVKGDINLVIYDGTVKLAKDKDYILKDDFKLSTNKKTATVSVVGIGNYKTDGDPAKPVKLTVAASGKKLITPDMVTIADQTYTGKALKPEVAVKDGSASLTAGTDFKVAFKNNTNVGTAIATITGKGNYAGKTIVQWNIKADAEKKLTNDSVAITTKAEKIIYNGKLQKPAVKVTNPLNGKKLSKNKDYRLYYATNLNVGTAKVIIVGIGNFAGQRAEKTFKILPCDIKKIKAVVSAGKLVSVTYNKKVLTAGADYTYKVEKNNKDKYDVTIDGTYKAEGDKITVFGNFETKNSKSFIKKNVKDIDYEGLGWTKPQ